MNTFTNVLLLFSCFYATEGIGQVLLLDNKTKIPIPNVCVVSQNKGLLDVSNEYGFIQLDTCSLAAMQSFDSIFLYHSSYQGKAGTFAEFFKSQIIYLDTFEHFQENIPWHQMGKNPHRVLSRSLLPTYQALSYLTYPTLDSWLFQLRYRGDEDVSEGMAILGILSLVGLGSIPFLFYEIERQKSSHAEGYYLKRR